MKQIDKDALVAEIERRILDIKMLSYPNNYDNAALQLYKGLLSFINTLEVQEVDLEKELANYYNGNFSQCNDGTLLSEKTGTELTCHDYECIAKHFLELGLKANQENNVIGTFEREVKIDAAGYPYIDEIEFYDYDKGMPLAKEGDKVTIIVVKEE